MKLWFDDKRPAPKGWTHCKHLDELKMYLAVSSNPITAISLDYDMDVGYPNGADAARYIAQEAKKYFDSDGREGLRPICVLVHTVSKDGADEIRNYLTIAQRCWTAHLHQESLKMNSVWKSK